MTTVSEKSKRERVASSVGGLVRERGVQAATVGRIIARAGMTRGSFYGLFENREDALRFAVAAGERRLLKAIDGAVAEEGSWEDRVAAALEAFLLAAQGDPPLAELALVFCVAGGRLGVGPVNPKLVDALAAALRPRPHPSARAPCLRSENLIALGIVGVVIGRLRRDEGGSLLALVPELTQLTTCAFAGSESDRRNSGLVAELT